MVKIPPNSNVDPVGAGAEHRRSVQPLRGRDRDPERLAQPLKHQLDQGPRLRHGHRRTTGKNGRGI